MFNALKRLISRAPTPVAPWADVSAWARAGGRVFKRTRDGEGFVIEGRHGDHDWRLEWGPPQRYYIEGHEVRLRVEVEVPGELQMLVMSQWLMRTLEEETFESFTDTVQTYVDDSAPEEMRWLAMFKKLDAAALGPARHVMGAVGLVLPAVAAWLSGPLSEQLMRLSANRVIAEDQPFTLMVQRGRLMVRASLRDPEPASLGAWVGVLETALDRLPAAHDALEAARQERADSRRMPL